MKADEELLKQKLEIIVENLEYLTSSDFNPENAGFEEKQAVKHCLLELAEASIDISSHIIASEGLDRPEDYAGLFQELGNEGFLNESLADKMSEMARFRNFLVHRYGDVDEKRLEAFIEEDLGDVRSFSESIYDYLDESTGI